MTPSAPTIGAPGPVGATLDAFASVNSKFMEAFQEDYSQLSTRRTGNISIYGSAADMIFGGATIYITIGGKKYNMGSPNSIASLFTNLNGLGLGEWSTNEDNFITVRGFQPYGNFVQSTFTVCSVESSTPTTELANIYDIVKELAAKLGPNALQVEDFAWGLGGNELQFEGFFGSTNDVDVIIGAYNAETIRIFSSGSSGVPGEVGIGINETPLAKFHVKATTVDQPVFYFEIESGNDSFMLNSDGSFSRDGQFYSIKTSTNTTWGALAGAAMTTPASNSIFGYHAARNLDPDGAGGGENNVVIGAAAMDLLILGHDNTMIGEAVDFSGGDWSDSIGLGSHTMVTASNQFVAGSATHYISDWYFGSGVTSSTTRDVNFHGTGGSGANKAAGNFIHSVGQSRGAGVSGKHIFRVTKVGSSGSSIQALYDAVWIDSTYMLLLPHGAGAGNTFELRFQDLAATPLTIGFKAPDAITTASIMYVLPAAAPTVGQKLTASAPASGVVTLSWT